MANTLKINGVTYSEVKKVEIPLADGSGDAVFLDTSDADAGAAHILDGKSGYVKGVKVDGSMPDRGAVNSEISTKDGTVSIQQGYHNGSGKVGIASAEKAKLIPGNIKAGATVLGVEGDSNVVDTSGGDAEAGHILNGKKAFVKGKMVTGTGTNPSISLTEGVLSIS